MAIIAKTPKRSTKKAPGKKTSKVPQKTLLGLNLLPKLPFSKPIAFVVAFGLVVFGYFAASSFAASAPIVGPDTSNWQSYLNTSQAYSQGYRFQIMKATEGLNYQDPRFGTSLADAKIGHLTPGAYHFLHRGSGAAQADYFINTVKAHNGGSTKGVAYMLDVESYGSTWPVYSDVTAFVARFKQLVPNRTLIIYTGKWFWGSAHSQGYIGDPPAPSGTVLDVSMYVTCTGSAWSILSSCVTAQGAPGEPYAADPINGWSSYFFRQYSSTAVFANVVTDANVTYKGSAALGALTGNAAATPTPTPKTPTPTPVPPPNKDVTSAQFANGIANKCLDDFQDSSTAGNKVDVYDCNGSAAQKWSISGNYVKINGKCLNVANNSTADGTHVILWDCSTASNNQWTYSGSTFKSVSSGKCLDNTGGSTVNGTQAQIWTCNGAKNQVWTQGTFKATPTPTVAKTPTPTPKTPTPTPVVSTIPSSTSHVVGVFGHGTNGHLYFKWDQNGSSTWSAWQDLGGTLASSPAAVSWAPGRFDVFAKSNTSSLLHKYFSNGKWSAWEDLGGWFSSAPSATSWGAGRLDVFVRGNDQQLYHRWYWGSKWSAWENLGGLFASAPGAASWGNGRLDVFVRGNDNGLYHKWYAGSWSQWENLGGLISDAPSVSSWGVGRLDVFVRGTDSKLYHKWFAGGWNANWEDLSGSFASGPAATSWSNAHIDVFVRGNDNHMYRKFYQNGWSAWQDLGGGFIDAPSAASWN